MTLFKGESIGYHDSRFISTNKPNLFNDKSKENLFKVEILIFNWELVMILTTLKFYCWLPLCCLASRTSSFLSTARPVNSRLSLTSLDGLLAAAFWLDELPATSGLNRLLIVLFFESLVSVAKRLREFLILSSGSIILQLTKRNLEYYIVSMARRTIDFGHVLLKR